MFGLIFWTSNAYLVVLNTRNAFSYIEASKKILQYLAACSGHEGTVDQVKDRLLESTPVLEVRMS